MENTNTETNNARLALTYKGACSKVILNAEGMIDLYTLMPDILTLDQNGLRALQSFLESTQTILELAKESLEKHTQSMSASDIKNALAARDEELDDLLDSEYALFTNTILQSLKDKGGKGFHIAQTESEIRSIRTVKGWVPA